MNNSLSFGEQFELLNILLELLGIFLFPWYPAVVSLPVIREVVDWYSIVVLNFVENI